MPNPKVEPDDDDENWPPWVTAKPEDNDIVMVDEQPQPPQMSDATRQTIKTPSFNCAVSRISGSIHFIKILLFTTSWFLIML